jgi:hypothetical protein
MDRTSLYIKQRGYFSCQARSRNIRIINDGRRRRCRNYRLTHDAVMTYSSNITPKSYSFSIIPCALFPTRTLWLKWWTWRHHYQTRKDIRARVVHQLVTKQHRQFIIHRTNEVLLLQNNVVDGTFLYVLRNIERGSIQESSRSLFTYSRDIRNQYDFCTPTQWRSMLSDWLTNASFSILYLLTPNYTRTRWRKLTKNVTSLSVKLSIDLDTGSISIVNPSSSLWKRFQNRRP